MEFALNVISTVCTVIATILAIYAARKYIFKEVYYGDKSVEEFKKMKLEDKDLKESYEYPPGNKRFPQIVIEKRIFNKIVTYYVIENNKRMVKVWNLK